MAQRQLVKVVAILACERLLLPSIIQPLYVAIPLIENA